MRCANDGAPTKANFVESFRQPPLAADRAGDKPFFATDLGRFHIADGLEILKTLPANSVDLVITSPPYDGQPKYGNGERLRA